MFDKIDDGESENWSVSTVVWKGALGNKQSQLRKFQSYDYEQGVITHSNIFQNDMGITTLKRKTETETHGTGIWMTDDPREYYSHVPHVNRAKGNILVGGLGLGMYIHMLLEGASTSHITVVEIDKELIELICELTPGLEDNPKVTIVCDDIEHYIKEYMGPAFNYVYIDI